MGGSRKAQGGDGGEGGSWEEHQHYLGAGGYPGSYPDPAGFGVHLLGTLL